MVKENGAFITEGEEIVKQFRKMFEELLNLQNTPGLYTN